MLYVLTADEYDCGEMVGHVVIGVYSTQRAIDQATETRLSMQGHLHQWETAGFGKRTWGLIEEKQEEKAAG